MYLSKWTLNQETILNKKMLDGYVLHQRVYDLFQNSDKRTFLYYPEKFDRRSREMRILVLSENKPSEPEYGNLDVKEIPEDYLSNKTFMFSCRLHAVIRKRDKTVPIWKEEDIFNWLKEREESWGVEFDHESLQRTESDSLFMFKRKAQRASDDKEYAYENIRIDYVEISGILCVKNEALFKTMFKNGIGRAKGFGMGMLRVRAIN